MRTVDIRRNRSELRTLVVPGLGGSGPMHWQSLWQDEHPEYERVVQDDWMSPDPERWARTVVDTVEEHGGPVMLVAHGFGCLAAVGAFGIAPDRIAGGLLVAPADPQRFPVAARLRRIRLGDTWNLVASRDDAAIAIDRSRRLALGWSSRFVDAGHVGQIDAQAGVGAWREGRQLLSDLAQRVRGQRASPVSQPALGPREPSLEAA